MPVGFLTWRRGPRPKLAASGYGAISGVGRAPTPAATEERKLNQVEICCDLVMGVLEHR